MEVYPIVSVLSCQPKLYLQSKFILSTFRSPLLSNYPSVNKKKVHCMLKVCSVFAMEWNWQLRGVFVLIVDQKKRKKNYGDWR